MEKTIKYVHHEVVHNFNAANVIVPELIHKINPDSVIDVGCGTGTWLKIFENHGVNEILGIDGDYVDLSKLKIDVNFFQPYDLEKEFKLNKKFDLAISLEVAEHLSYESSDTFVNTLCNLSDTIVFSAAITNQGGQNHINEQEPKFWIEKFQKRGFELFDVLRPLFWNNDAVDFWYRQNIFLFTKNDLLKSKLTGMESFSGNHLVHPDCFREKHNHLSRLKNDYDKLLNGKKGKKLYVKLFLNSVGFHFKNV